MNESGVPLNSHTNMLPNTSQSRHQIEHQEFLNSLRERLNVDDSKLANLEHRISGKSSPFS